MITNSHQVAREVVNAMTGRHMDAETAFEHTARKLGMSPWEVVVSFQEFHENRMAANDH